MAMLVLPVRRAECAHSSSTAGLAQTTHAAPLSRGWDRMPGGSVEDMAGKRTRQVRVDLATDNLIADTARLQRRSKKDVVASAMGAYVEANREVLDGALDATSYRIETAADPHVVDPRTGLTRAEMEELFRFM